MPGSVHDLLQTVHIRRKGGNKNPALRLMKGFLQMGAYKPFRRGEARPLGIRALGQQKLDSFFTDRRHFMYIGILFVDRGHIELEIAGMNDSALRRIEYNA
ncbi:hypothetical protein D3C75_649350 [compost metagenome]